MLNEIAHNFMTESARVREKGFYLCFCLSENRLPTLFMCAKSAVCQTIVETTRRDARSNNGGCETVYGPIGEATRYEAGEGSQFTSPRGTQHVFKLSWHGWRTRQRNGMQTPIASHQHSERVKDRMSACTGYSGWLAGFLPLTWSMCSC